MTFRVRVNYLLIKLTVWRKRGFIYNTHQTCKNVTGWHTNSHSFPPRWFHDRSVAYCCKLIIILIWWKHLSIPSFSFIRRASQWEIHCRSNDRLIFFHINIKSTHTHIPKLHTQIDACFRKLSMLIRWKWVKILFPFICIHRK